MIRLKNAREIDGIRRSGRLLARALAALAAETREGATTRDLDAFVRSYLAARGGRPSFLGYLDFPASVCISVNEEVIHGIPGPRRLRDGDLVSLDLGVDLDGYFSDAAVSVAIGRATDARRRLLATTRECLDRALAAARPGNRVSDISRAVFDHASANGYGVVREYCGHGVGFAPHEDPQVPNYVGGGPNPRLKEGMVLAVEPMINAGTGDIELLDDGWTVVTGDGADSAHFEHTIVVAKNGMEILTRLE
ncbi:MAG: type I methionyl aminopeptidase [Spirochaetes bacterium RBG_13_68_11]|nr:MAG: type I methionyl aminopeptidase [Spirochaetes bacterium RBG_13_68_11]